MKKNYLIIVLCFLSFLGCKKDNGGGGGSSDPPEADLVVSINPDPGSSVAPALSSTYTFRVTISSTLPKNGVKFEMTGLKESDNSTFFSQTSQTSGNTVNYTDLTISNLSPGILCVVTVDVTSLSKPSNKKTVTFKIARK